MKLMDVNIDYEEKRKRLDGPVIPNTVKLVVGIEVFELSGHILAHHSPVVFLDLISRQSELYLDEFADCTEAFKECIELLNGAEIDMTLEKLQVFMKFAVLYGVKEILYLSLSWATDNICLENVKAILKISFVVRLCEEKHPGFEIYHTMDELGEYVCVEFITQSLEFGDGLYAALDLPQDPEDISDFDVVASVFYSDAIFAPHSILVPITAWINSSVKADHIMKEIETNGYYGDRGDFKDVKKDVFLTFLEKLTEFCTESFESLKLLNKIQMNLLKAGYCNAKGCDVKIILSKAKGWRNFDEKQIKCSQERFMMEKFQYAEIILDWIRINKPSQKVVNELWAGLKSPCQSIFELSGLSLPLEYVQSLRYAVMETHCYEVPAPEAEEYTYCDGCDANPSQNGALIKSALINPAHAVLLLGSCNISKCEKETEHGMILRLVDSTPCFDLLLEKVLETDKYHYHHHKIHHWYLTTQKDGKDVLFSLITNTLEEVLEMLRNVKQEDCLNCHYLLE